MLSPIEKEYTKMRGKTAQKKIITNGQENKKVCHVKIISQTIVADGLKTSINGRSWVCIHDLEHWLHHEQNYSDISLEMWTDSDPVFISWTSIRILIDVDIKKHIHTETIWYIQKMIWEDDSTKRPNGKTSLALIIAVDFIF